MKFIVKLILIAVFSYFAQLYYPWWSVVVASFFVGIIAPGKGLNAFMSGFIGVGLLWFTYAAIIDMETNSILTEKVANIFSLPNSFYVLIITGVIGGIAAGFGALSGNYFRAMFTRRRTGNYYR
jgi:hypothetical protein